MKVSLYLTDFKIEKIKKDDFIKLYFFDSLEGATFTTFYEINYFKKWILERINNANPEILAKLKEEVER